MWDESFSLTPLGGGREIGANCFYVEWDDVRFLVDCGMHPERPAWFGTPQLWRIKRLDFVLVTHAHNDHIGALPYLTRLFPDVPVYMTAGTRELAQVMLRDAVKFMRLLRREPDPDRAADRFDRGRRDWRSSREPEPEWEDLLFDQRDVTRALADARDVGTGFLYEGLEVIPFPCGHILGGVGYVVRKNGKSVLFTSDMSLDSKATAPDFRAPDGAVDLLVCESTYGRVLATSPPVPRAEEARRLVARAGEIARGGGAVLFPSFVIERAQEIALLLGAAIRSGEIPRLPVFVLGMGRRVSEIHAKALDLRIDFDDAEFEDVAYLLGVGHPAYVICGSGMLNAGSSAARLAADLLTLPTSGVLFTGYCTPRSGGARLLAGGPGPTLVNGKVIDRRTPHVAQFRLSCHATGGQLIELAKSLEAKAVVLTHGDATAVETLSGGLHAAGFRQVFAPKNGESVAFGDGAARLGESLEALRGRLADHVAAGDAPRALAVGRRILDDAPWDLETLGHLAALESPDREGWRRKRGALVRALCDDAVREGAFDEAERLLGELDPALDADFARRKAARLAELRAQLAGEMALTGT